MHAGKIPKSAFGPMHLPLFLRRHYWQYASKVEVASALLTVGPLRCGQIRFYIVVSGSRFRAGPLKNLH